MWESAPSTPPSLLHDQTSLYPHFSFCVTWVVLSTFFCKSLRSRIGCRQVENKYHCICWGKHRKPSLQQMCLSSPWAEGPGMCPCVLTDPMPSLTYTAFPFHCRVRSPPDTLVIIHLVCCVPHSGYQNPFLLT